MIGLGDIAKLCNYTFVVLPFLDMCVNMLSPSSSFVICLRQLCSHEIGSEMKLEVHFKFV